MYVVDFRVVQALRRPRALQDSQRLTQSTRTLQIHASHSNTGVSLAFIYRNLSYDRGSGARIEIELKSTPQDVSFDTCGNVFIRPSLPVQNYKRGPRQRFEGLRWPSECAPVMWMIMMAHNYSALGKRKVSFAHQRAASALCQALYFMNQHPRSLTLKNTEHGGLSEFCLGFRHIIASLENNQSVDDEVGTMAVEKFRRLLIHNALRMLSHHDIREFIETRKNRKVDRLTTFFETSVTTILHFYVRDGKRAIGFVSPGTAARHDDNEKQKVLMLLDNFLRNHFQKALLRNYDATAWGSGRNDCEVTSSEFQTLKSYLKCCNCDSLGISYISGCSHFYCRDCSLIDKNRRYRVCRHPNCTCRLSTMTPATPMGMLKVINKYVENMMKSKVTLSLPLHSSA